MPDWHFKELLDYLNLDPIQEESDKKRENSINQKDRHTVVLLTLQGRNMNWMYLHESNNKILRKSRLHKHLHRESCKRKEGNIVTLIIEKIKMIYWSSPSRSPKNIHTHGEIIEEEDQEI